MKDLICSAARNRDTAQVWQGAREEEGSHLQSVTTYLRLPEPLSVNFVLLPAPHVLDGPRAPFIHVGLAQVYFVQPRKAGLSLLDYTRNYG